MPAAIPPDRKHVGKVSKTNSHAVSTNSKTAKKRPSAHNTQHDPTFVERVYTCLNYRIYKIKILGGTCALLIFVWYFPGFVLRNVLVGMLGHVVLSIAHGKITHVHAKEDTESRLLHVLVYDVILRQPTGDGDFHAGSVTEIVHFLASAFVHVGGWLREAIKEIQDMRARGRDTAVEAYGDRAFSTASLIKNKSRDNRHINAPGSHSLDSLADSYIELFPDHHTSLTAVYAPGTSLITPTPNIHHPWLMASSAMPQPSENLTHRIAKSIYSRRDKPFFQAWWHYARQPEILSDADIVELTHWIKLCLGTIQSKRSKLNVKLDEAQKSMLAVRVPTKMERLPRDRAARKKEGGGLKSKIGAKETMVAVVESVRDEQRRESTAGDLVGLVQGKELIIGRDWLDTKRQLVLKL
ncbi:hypothetical protein CC86DRAFT_382974 [Ophiobolus disseminans]|uniref:Uncharacterized protein n=1 Tax=Ophiobolus disseminans TaxID=1469910 RepID=A0A6A6ZZC9_9PLEO|nr:hypothetical protein CC86DRAFT_382974 [Ophiobolus disseminans]